MLTLPGKSLLLLRRNFPFFKLGLDHLYTSVVLYRCTWESIWSPNMLKWLYVCNHIIKREMKGTLHLRSPVSVWLAPASSLRKALHKGTGILPTPSRSPSPALQHHHSSNLWVAAVKCWRYIKPQGLTLLLQCCPTRGRHIQTLLQCFWLLHLQGPFPLQASVMSSDCLWSERSSFRGISPTSNKCLLVQKGQEMVFCLKSEWWKIPFAGLTLSHKWGLSITSPGTIL